MPNSSACGRHTRVSSPGSGLRSSVKWPEWRITALPSLNVPTRSLGPCRSHSTVIGRLTTVSSARIAAIVAAWVAWSPWLMFTRKASTPARNSFSSISGVRLAGPTVARILTLRPRGLCAAAPSGRGSEFAMGSAFFAIVFQRARRCPTGLPPHLPVVTPFKSVFEPIGNDWRLGKRGKQQLGIMPHDLQILWHDPVRGYGPSRVKTQA